MTIGELIEALRAFSPDQTVSVYASYRPIRTREPIPETHRSRREVSKVNTNHPSDNWVPMGLPYGNHPEKDKPFEEKDVVFL